MLDLRTHEWDRRTREILSQARNALRESKQQEVQDLEGWLPDGAGSEDGPLTIALAGQYSAGKSTILKVLTGREDIGTGAGITTDETRTFDWNGVRIIDTPGIHTKVRPDHDSTAYRAISESDLLVFVITNELFDSHLGDHFRKLAVDEGKGHEMVLVVNKMDRMAEGNTPASRATLIEDLRESLHPFSPEGLRSTFTDALSALAAIQEEDEEIREARHIQANMEDLIENLNDLIRDGGLNNRHTTALYTIDRTMQEAIAAEPTGDEDLDSLVTIYIQNIRVVEETILYMRQAVRNAIDETTLRVSRVGSECADKLYPGIKREEWEGEPAKLESQSEKLWQDLMERIEKECAEIMPEMQERLDELHNSHRFQGTLTSIRDRSSGRNITGALKIARAAADRLGQVGRHAAMPTGARGLAAFSGTPAHGMVLNIGHRLGHSFQPWQAVKIARGVGAASAILSVATIGLDVWMQAREDAEADRQDRELMDIRREVRAHANNIARQMDAEAIKVSEEVIREFLTGPMEEMQGQVDELNRERENRNTHLGRLSSVSEQARGLIAEMHGEGVPGKTRDEEGPGTQVASTA